MQEAVPVGKGSMIAVLGLKLRNYEFNKNINKKEFVK
jgi:hypothetical protein